MAWPIPGYIISALEIALFCKSSHCVTLPRVRIGIGSRARGQLAYSSRGECTRPIAVPYLLVRALPLEAPVSIITISPDPAMMCK